MQSPKHNDIETTLRPTARSHRKAVLVGGVVLGVIVGAILVVFILSPLVTAGYDLLAGFWARIRNAVGPV